MSRDSVIQIVGSVIGRDHPVSLKDYDVLILVETVKVRHLWSKLMQNITGISIVRDFDKLKRFNVEQLYDQYQSTNRTPVRGRDKCNGGEAKLGINVEAKDEETGDGVKVDVKSL